MCDDPVNCPIFHKKSEEPCSSLFHTVLTTMLITLFDRQVIQLSYAQLVNSDVYYLERELKTNTFQIQPCTFVQTEH